MPVPQIWDQFSDLLLGHPSTMCLDDCRITNDPGHVVGWRSPILLLGLNKLSARCFELRFVLAVHAYKCVMSVSLRCPR
jgi:hypothetical protein